MNKFTTLTTQMSALVEEHGFYRTLNVICLAYEREHITEPQFKTLRFSLAMQYQALRSTNGHINDHDCATVGKMLNAQPHRPESNQPLSAMYRDAAAHEHRLGGNNYG